MCIQGLVHFSPLSIFLKAQVFLFQWYIVFQNTHTHTHRHIMTNVCARTHAEYKHTKKRQSIYT
jgi:hypothetical protein